MPQLNRTASIGAANSMASSLLGQADSGAAQAAGDADAAMRKAASMQGGVDVLGILKSMKLKQDESYFKEIEKLTRNGLQEMEQQVAEIQALGSGVGKDGTP